MTLSRNQKIGIAVAGGAGLLFLLTRKASASEGTSADIPLPKTDGASATLKGTTDGCSTGKADKESGFPKDLSPTENEITKEAAKASGDEKAYKEAYGTAYSSCYDSAEAPKEPAKTPDKPKPSVGKPTKYNAEWVVNPARAHSLSIAAGNSKPSADWAAANPTRVASNGTFKTWADYGAYPGNAYSVGEFQSSAGLENDKIVGNLTSQAYDYWYTHG
jgi:hypothetical protein